MVNEFHTFKEVLHTSSIIYKTPRLYMQFVNRIVAITSDLE